MADVYLDESGFTGIDLLLADQPVFVSASTILSAEEAQELLDVTLGPLPNGATEWSHSRLVASAGGRRRLVEFIRALHLLQGKAAYYMMNKRFALLAKLVDNWIEPAMYETGFDLYGTGAQLALANAMYYCLQGFEGPERFEELLRCYQAFTRDMTDVGFAAFLAIVECLFETARHEGGQEFIGYVLIGLKVLGTDHIASLTRAPSNDIPYPSVFFTIAHWDKTLAGPFGVVHDES